MTVALLETRPAPATAAVAGLRLIVLARMACDEGVSRPELARELTNVVSGIAGRLAIDTEVAQLVRGGFSIEQRSRFSASPTGLARLLTALGLKSLPNTWAEMRDVRLIAKALGLETQSPARIKALADADALRVEVLAERYGLVMRGRASPAKVRAALALVALEQAFGNKIKGELTTGTDFNAKAARVLAGQLLAKPRDAGTDKRLVALLAAEVVGSARYDVESLRAALLRKLAGAVAAASPSDAKPAAEKRNAPQRALAPAIGNAPSSRPAAASRPDLQGFVKVVQQLAGQHADGWPGNRKALVSQVFAAIADRYPGWGLTLVEFKAMLAECHRTRASGAGDGRSQGQGPS